jgi:predicted RNA binding protein YcfA (HicA-like mRNA interferase family)
MGKHDKIMDKILRGASDSNIAFDDIRSLLLHVGFEERIRGSHHLYRKEGVEEKINIQRTGNKAKPYQVKQVREVILKYHLAGEQ